MANNIACMRVLYIVVDGILCPGFDSQVLAEVTALQAAGLDVRLIVWTPRRDRQVSLDKAADLSRRMAGRIALLERGLHKGRMSLPGYLRALRAVLRGWRWDDDLPLLVHARSPMAGVIALAWRRHHPNVRVITDYRGSMYEEFRQALRRQPLVRRTLGRFFLREMRSHEIHCARHSDAIRCISTPGKQTIIETFGAEEGRVTVVPCYVNTDLFRYDPQEREQARAELRIEPGRFVIVFSGSLGCGYGYSTRQVFETYRKLRFRRPCNLLLITPHPQDARRAMCNSDVPNDEVRLLTGRIEDVARWCQAGDLGLILLPRDEARRACCPIKFGEYLRAGMRVLTTPGLGDLPEWIPRLRVGHVVDIEAASLPDELTESYGDEERYRISAAAADLLGHEVHLPRIVSLYDRLLHP